MNNLLRTLTESRVKSEPSLKLLLTTVKDARRQCYDTKLADPFYDSLEGLLSDLRTVTMDSHDAEAFLRPVSRADVPDYYDVITNPMDLHTMSRKVKQKQYKTKKEFKDDLDLIWQNCFTYNAAENHPLRLCAQRLRLKAQKLLRNITDRKERIDPSIPTALGGTLPKVNGFVNGHSHHYSPPLKSGTSVIKQSTKQKQDVSFSEIPAIARTAAGMSTFLQLDRDLDRNLLPSTSTAQSDHNDQDIIDRLKQLTSPPGNDTDIEDIDSPDGSIESIGEKRKLNALGDHRVHKRARFSMQVDFSEDIADLWWKAVVSDPLLANGVPGIPCISSRHAKRVAKAAHGAPKAKSNQNKATKKTASPQSLLCIMNNNIRTTNRVRRTHAKFAALNQISGEEGDSSLSGPLILGEEEVDDVVDDRPWQARASGIELGEENATDCLQWMSMKVLEHVGFQGSSKMALDVLTSVTSEYFLNVGRTIRFMCDKYSHSMTPEEIILHTLFESGTSKIQDLEKYIKDDVIRYGHRLAELEKKLESAYREATVVEALDDDALFGHEEEEEEEGAFVMGNFADSFGEDFLGLRELGIAAEHGLSSLTIPKRLLKGKGRGENKGMSSVAGPTEPPPPFPPPPPFVPLDSSKLDHQIGLLKPFFQERFAALYTSTLSSSQPQLQLPLDGNPLHPPGELPPATVPSSSPAVPTILPDDPPDLSHVKMGPLGQIIKVASSSAPKKKPKKKDTSNAIDGDGGLSMIIPLSTTALGSPGQASPKKKAPGVVTGTGNKKKAKVAESLPPVITASA